MALASPGSIPFGHANSLVTLQAQLRSLPRPVPLPKKRLSAVGYLSLPQNAVAFEFTRRSCRDLSPFLIFRL